MNPYSKSKLLQKMISLIESSSVSNWGDISSFLKKVKNSSPELVSYDHNEFKELVSKGVSFITYDFGIDGVSIEIFKYATILESIYSTDNKPLPLHFMGGDFHDKADVVLKPEWNRFKIDGINGWSKWYDGKWFSKLFYEDMPEGSDVSDKVAKGIWAQAVSFAEKLGTYLVENDINLLIPVNIPTNPGNVSIMLAIVITTEILGTYVISSNHDFYWEGGKPAFKKEPDEEPGPRDHFFRNIDNRPFFEMFKSIYPWNGKRWVQANINTPQTRALIENYGFDKKRVFELGTSISDEFFKEFTYEDQKRIRKKMDFILSDGQPAIYPVNVKDHLANLSAWVNNQKPIVCAYHSGLELDLAKDNTLYCLQPTRVISRKRIDKDLELLEALMKYPPFFEEFANNPKYQLVMHITGPVPIEHQEDLEVVLNAFVELCESVDDSVSRRIFLAFSVGTEKHPSLAKHGFKSLCIEEIYRLATVILFPSETEGRGLPIIESSAGGIPIICSRYYPEDVFAEVVGENCPDKEQIHYFLFPEEGFSNKLLASVKELLLNPENFEEHNNHNKKAVHLRYSTEMIRKKFEEIIETLRATS